MWRILTSITRGARNVRPSQCCTQDSRDDTCCNPIEQPTTSLSYSVALRRYGSCEDVVKPDNVCPVYALTNYVYKRFAEWSGSVDSKNGRDKLVWVLDIPSDVCPHARPQWDNLDRRAHTLFTLGWGSVAAALTWGVFQGLRTSPFWYQQNGIDLAIENKPRCDYSCGTRSKTAEDEGCNLAEDEGCKKCHDDIENSTSTNHGYPEQRCSSHRARPGCYPSLGFPYQHHYPWIDPQNPNWKTSIQPDLLNIFNPEVNKSLFASICTTTAEKPLAERGDLNEKKKDASSHALLANVSNIDIFVDIEHQFEVDKQELERYNSEKTPDDSGYAERGYEACYFSSARDDVSVCNHEAGEDIVVVTPSLHHSEKLETCNVAEEECNESKIVTEQHILSNDRHLSDFEQPFVVTEKSEKKLSVKEEVLIEDCSCYDSLQNDASISAQATVFKTKVSSPKQNTIATGIDEFSDGLKEILEAGRKDLNDFNTQFLGVLEGNIGRSVSDEEPDLAIAYFRAGALLGDPSSSYNLGLCYHFARGVERDLEMARELYEAASLLGHGWATYNLAVLLSEGQGGPADPVKAHALLTKAVKLGVHEAQLGLEQMEKLQAESCRHEKQGSPGAVQSEQRGSLGIVQSEPALSSVLSNMWSFSYSTTDLNFLEDSFDEQEALSSFRMEATEKPRFYLE